MAITIKTKGDMSLPGLMYCLYDSKLDDYLSADTPFMAEELHQAGYTLGLSPKRISILTPASGPIAVHEIASVPLSLTAFTEATTLPGAAGPKKAVRLAVWSLITIAWTKTEGHFHSKTMAEYSQNGLVAAVKFLRNSTGWSLKAAKDKVDQWVKGDYILTTSTAVEPVTVTTSTAVEPVEVIDSIHVPYKPSGSEDPSTVVAMKSATIIHQAVHGTSVDSKYYVIALGEDVVIAARIKNANDISLRALYKGTLNDKTKLGVIRGFEKAGFKKASSGHHYSLHLTPHNINFAYASIGGLLFKTGLTFVQVSGHLPLLVGKK